MEAKRNSLQNIACIALVTALILLIPVLGNWPWTRSDFVVMGTLLFGTGLTYELLAIKMSNAKNRAILAIILVGLLLLAWAELAVGLFGTPFAGS